MTVAKLYIIDICSTFRDLYWPTSTVYAETNVGDQLAENLKSSDWDSSKPLGRVKEVRPYDKHAGPRGYRGVRDVGKYKMDECRFQKL